MSRLLSRIRKQVAPPYLFDNLSRLVIPAFAFIGWFVLDVAIANHAGGLATSIVDSADALGLSDIWELQANLKESHLYMTLMMWGFHPSACLLRLLFGDTWAALYGDLLVSVFVVVACGWIVFRYSREVTGDSLTTFLLVVLFFLLPVVFVKNLYWYGQPVFLMLMGALYLMRRGRRWPAVILLVWAHGCHPMSTPVFLGLAWSCFRLDLKGRRPILPGLEKRDAAAARSWRFSFITSCVLAAWTVFLVVGSKMIDGGTGRGLLWDFFSGKFDPGTLGVNLSQALLFMLPLLFIPLVSRVWIPATLVFFGYVIFGSQGIVTGFVLPGATFCVLATAYWLAGRPVGSRRRIALLAVTVAVGVNLLAPWPRIFPMYPDPLTGGLFARHSWQVQPQEAAINSMIERNIPKQTQACLTTWQISPVMAQKCVRVTTLSFPFRRSEYELMDFIEVGDGGRISTGGWNFILIDTRREAYSRGLDVLLNRIETSGMWKLADRTAESFLYRRKDMVVSTQL